MIKNVWLTETVLLFRSEKKRFNRKPMPNRQIMTGKKLHLPSPAKRFEFGKRYCERENMPNKVKPAKKKNHAFKTE